MFENPRRGRQATNFATNVRKILDLKSSSEQIFSEDWRWLPLFSSLFINHLEQVHSRLYMFLRKRRVSWMSALQISGENRNRFESPLGVWTNPVCKISWASLPAKQAINEKLLRDWGNIDLPKLKPVEHISLMPSSCLCLTLTSIKCTPGYTPISYSLRLSQSGTKWTKRGSYSRRSFPSRPIPPPFFPSSPSPFRRLLRRLPSLFSKIPFAVAFTPDSGKQRCIAVICTHTCDSN